MLLQIEETATDVIFSRKYVNSKLKPDKMSFFTTTSKTKTPLVHLLRRQKIVCHYLLMQKMERFLSNRSTLHEVYEINVLRFL